jgi:hypothetical protein
VKLSRLLLVVLALGSVVFLLQTGSALARGHLDPSFGDGGVVDLDADGDPFSGLGAIAVGRDAIYFTEEASVCNQGGCPNRVYLKRYGADGRLDRSFGDGRVVAGTADNYAALAVDSAGRPLVAFEHEDGLVVRRFSPQGLADRGFGNEGSVFVPCDCFLGSLEVGPGDEPFLVAHSEFERTSPFRGVIWVFARLRRDGSRDPSFGGDGVVRRPMPGFYSPSASLSAGGGAVLYGFVCCRFPSRPFIQRISKGGRLQRHYASATKRSLHGLYGTREDDVGWEGAMLVRHSRGRVELFADTERGLAVRLLRNGKRDRSYGRGGVKEFDFEVSGATADGRDGAFLAAWVRGRGYEAMRTLPDGRLDREFGQVELPGASNEEGLVMLSQGRGAAIAFDRGLSFCRFGCDDDPKMFRVVDSGR